MNLKAHLCIFLLLSFIQTAFSAPKQQISIAVQDLSAKGVAQADADILSDRIRTELVNTGLFRVMERGQMESILKEQGFQKSGICEEQSCMVEVGQLLGVQRILSGTIGKIGQTYTITVRLIDVQSGEILIATTVDCKCAIDVVLQKSTKEIIQLFVQKNSPAPEKPPTAEQPSSNQQLKTSLAIRGKPEGSSVFINGSLAGKVPLKIDSIQPGSAAIKAELQGYQPIEKTIEIKQGKENVFSVDLKALSSGPAKKSSRLTLKIISGGLAIAGIGAGYYYDTQVKSKMNANTSLLNQYNAQPTASNYSSISPRYDKNWKDAKNFSNLRMASYALSGVSCIGFALTFAF